jgi:hypothetical protein
MNLCDKEGAIALGVTVGTLAVSTFSGWQSTLAAIDRARETLVDTICCANLTLPATSACINLIGEIAKDIKKLDDECDRLPQKKSESTFHAVLWGTVALGAAAGCALFWFRKCYLARRRPEYHSIH